MMRVFTGLLKAYKFQALRIIDKVSIRLSKRRT